MSGLFAINKPSGISSAGLLNELQNILKVSPLFEPEIKAQQARTNAGRKGRKQKFANKIKMGHGGTLDPLASGVLVVGTGRGTKDLGKFLHCSKDYEAVALFGCSTDTYDSEGKIVHRRPWQHITPEKIESVLQQFRGDIMQTPPIYSALKMQGKPLYEYAREGKPLPAEIKARPATVSRFEMTRFAPEHEWAFPKEDAPLEIVLSAEVLEKMPKSKQNSETNQAAGDEEISTSKSDTDNGEPPLKKVRQSSPEAASAETSDSRIIEHNDTSSGVAVHLRMTVSSGTYVRSLIHDLGLALGSAAHMVALVRKRVGEFKIEDSIAWPAFEQDEWQAQLKKKLDFGGSDSEHSEGAPMHDDALNTLTCHSRSATLQQVEDFLKPALPFKITLTYAQSLDGKISGPHSKPLIISCRESFCVTHELRRLHDYILVGVGTVMSDNPGLNARAPSGLPYPCADQPYPIILDPNARLRLTPKHKMMQNYQSGTGRLPLQIVSNKSESFESIADVVAIPSFVDEHGGKHKFLWSDVFAVTRLQGKSIMIEGGARIIKDVLEQHAADQIIVTIAPTFIGEGTDVSLKNPIQLANIRTEVFGRDTMVSAQFATP